MKTLICLGPLLLTFAGSSALASEKWEAHTPKGWRVILDTSGDLTGDKKPEAVIVVEEQDKSKIIGNDRLGNQTLNTNPRRLIVLTPTTTGYRQIQSVGGFLPSEGDAESSCLADPLMENGGIEIKKGVLIVTLNYWLSCGSYGVTKDIFRFRQQGSRFRLIGKGTKSYSRSSGEGEEISINYLTGRKRETTGITVIEPDEGGPVAKPKTKWSRIPAEEYQFLDNVTTAQ
jgi:hypothetical protein